MLSFAFTGLALSPHASNALLDVYYDMHEGHDLEGEAKTGGMLALDVGALRDMNSSVILLRRNSSGLSVAPSTPSLSHQGTRDDLLPSSSVPRSEEHTSELQSP